MRSLVIATALAIPALARADAALKGDVLVSDDATFYAEPADDAATMQLAKLDASSPAAVVGRAVPMHVVGRHGDFIEVEQTADGQCTGETFVAGPVAHVRVFVKEDALAPVLIKRWHAGFTDGSRVTLDVGTPVATLDDGGIAFALDDATPHAYGEAASIGLSYPAITPRSLLPDRPRFELRAGASAQIAGGTYTVPTMLFLHAASAIEHPHKDMSRFPILLRCGQADVVVPDDAVAPYHALELPGMGMGVGHGADEYLIPKGTPLSTPGGRRAAVADDDIVVPPPAAGATTACFDAPVTLSRAVDAPTAHETPIDGNKISLCAPVARLRREQGFGHYGTLGHRH